MANVEQENSFNKNRKKGKGFITFIKKITGNNSNTNTYHRDRALQVIVFAIVHVFDVLIGFG